MTINWCGRGIISFILSTLKGEWTLSCLTTGPQKWPFLFKEKRLDSHMFLFLIVGFLTLWYLFYRVSQQLFWLRKVRWSSFTVDTSPNHNLWALEHWNLFRHPVFSWQYYEFYEENFMQIPLHFSTVFLTLVNSSLRSILQEQWTRR